MLPDPLGTGKFKQFTATVFGAQEQLLIDFDGDMGWGGKLMFTYLKPTFTA
ncbi:hypothetical protein ACFOET_07260 [Parapedobacter deserti]|uniref:Uncharacterized protein n=1 Tax=Parapedobacter deserti TaxID=1912957 RepID=A0ABV7JMW1_9SPHI